MKFTTAIWYVSKYWKNCQEIFFEDVKEDNEKLFLCCFEVRRNKMFLKLYEVANPLMH